MKDDDNQKFLNKFKDQISTMGKEGILGVDNNISSISNSNYTINSTFNNNNTKVIFKNSLSDKNTIRKGSAFLKPINKSKINNKNNINLINKNEQSKNLPKEDLSSKNKIENNEGKINIMNNPYSINPQNKLNEIIYNPSMLYYQYQNPYLFMNYNQNQNKIEENNINNNINNAYNNNPPQPIYSPYQLYYYSNPYINNNINNN